MRIAILGAGAIGLAMAALCAGQGHAVSILSPSGRRTAFLRDRQPLRAVGSIEGSWHPDPASSVAAAVAGAKLIILALPAYGHRTIIDQLATCAVPAQAVIISSHSSLAALYLSKRLAERGIEVPIAAWSTTLVTARQTAADTVEIDAIRQRIDVATLHDPQNRLAEIAGGLFKTRFHKVPDLLALDLSNLNPPIHLANALGNLTRIERGEYWANYDGITPAVARLIEALDKERLSLASALGYCVRTVQEHYVLTFGLEPATVAEMAARVHQRRGGPPGPTSLATRYIAEDVPFGLVPLLWIAESLGLPLPIHDAGIRVIEIFCGKPLRGKNDILPALGLHATSMNDLRVLVRDGWPGGDR